MQLTKINIETLNYETPKAILINKDLWIPKSSILRKEDKHLIVKSWFLKGKEINCEKVSLSQAIDTTNLKPLPQYLNTQTSNYFPKDAMKHQELAFNFAKGLKTVALFMDMGTGKSKLYIDLANYHYEAGNIDNVILFAPPTTLDNFNNEINKWQKSNLKWSTLSIHNLSIREYTIKLDNLLKKITPKTLIVIDESHRIKNIKSLMSKIAKILGDKAQFKIIGTGTPSANSPEDLIGQFRFLTPDEFRISDNQLKKRYFKIGDKGINKGSKNELELLEKTFSYTYSITKDQCLNLPPKIYNNISVNDDKLLNFYNNSFNEVSIDFMGSSGTLMGFLQNLRKLATGRDRDNKVIVKNPKIKYLKDLLEDIQEDKIIIWHNFYNEIDDILEAISCKDYMLLNGNMNKAEKTFAEHEFKNNPKIKYLISTESVGGIGLNFQTYSNICIYFSNSFSLIDRLQSENRIHRLGTVDQCIYYDLITNGTIDNKIKKSLYRKADFLQDLQDIYKKEGKKAVIKALKEVINEKVS